MTEKKANEYFKTKYPNGEIRRPNSTSSGYKYWVIFDKSNPKVYSYSAPNYSALLGKLKIRGFEDWI